MKTRKPLLLAAFALSTSCLIGCVATIKEGISKIEAENQKAAEDLKAMCAEMRAELPINDSYFDLKGKVTFETGWGKLITHDILQFGRQDKYFQYSVNSPQCGSFGLYQVKLIKREGSLNNIGSIRYKVVLKNNKSFQTKTNIPFCWTNAEKPGSCAILTASAINDKEKNLYFRYLFSDPSSRKPIEATLDHLRMLDLEVY